MNEPDYVEIVNRIPVGTLFTFDRLGRFSIRRSDVERLIDDGWLIEYRGYVYFSEEAIRSMIDGVGLPGVVVPGGGRFVPLAFIPGQTNRRVTIGQRLFRWFWGHSDH